MKPETISGVHSVCEALRARRRNFYSISIAQGASEKKFNQIISLASNLAIKIRKEPRENLNRSSSSQQHQGVVASVSPYPYVTLKEVLGDGAVDPNKEPAPILILDGLEDPHNVGALLRTALASGVRGVVIPKHHVAQITPTVSRVSAGAAEHLMIANVSNWTGVIKEIKKKGYWLVGLDASADSSIFELDIPKPTALVIGGEGAGMRVITKKHCDLICTIPMKGRVSSLNASVAGGIALYEVFRGCLEKSANQ